MLSENPQGLIWPAEFDEVLPELRSAWGVKDELYINRILGGGRSGALVYAVDVSMEAYTGQAILKLEKVRASKEQKKLESSLHEASIADAPGFAEQHLPQVIASLSHKDSMALLSTIAGRGLEFSTTWEEAPYNIRQESIKRVSRSLLEDWNSDYALSPGVVKPAEMLGNWLEKRLYPEQGGRIHDFVENACQVPRDVPTILFEGHWYPNPLAFFDEAIGLPERLNLRGAMGHVHGDLNGRNLLVSKATEINQSFHLIDLAHYRSQQYLFFDHAYFEISLMISSRGKCTPRQWEAILNQLRHKGHHTSLGMRTDDLGLLELINALRGEVLNWIERHEGNRVSFMESQVLLARVAAGLSFVHKKISTESRELAFIYAAACLKDYIKLNQIEWPKMGVPFEIGIASGTPLSSSGTAPAASSTSTPVAATEQETTTRQDAVRSSVRSEPRVESPASAPQRSTEAGGFQWARKSRILPVAAALIAVVALVGSLVAFWNPPWRGVGTSVSDSISTSAGLQDFAAIPSIGVLPFRNLSNVADSSFSDGLTIEIISVLASTGAFRIPGFTSVFPFKDNPANLKQIGERLNVEYIIEGTVRQVGDEYRIEVHLVRTDDGFLVWNGAFREELGELFLVQEKLAEAIGVALSIPLDVDPAQLEAQRTRSPEAYEAFLSGIGYLEQRGEGLERAIQEFENAVALERDFASAWAALSMAYNIAPRYSFSFNSGPVAPATYYRRAKSAALRAININPNYSIVRHAAANQYQRELQWDEAERMYRGALRSDGANHRAMEDFAGLLQTIGRPEEALEMLVRARELEPLDPLYTLMEAWVSWQQTGSEDDVETVRNVFLESEDLRQFAFRIFLNQSIPNGGIEDAKALLSECSSCSDSFKSRAMSLLLSAESEPIETVFETFKDDPLLSYSLLYEFGGEDAVLDAYHYNSLVSLYRLDFFTVPWSLIDKIGQSPRFQEITRDIGLSEYWSLNGWPEECRESDLGFACG